MSRFVLDCSVAMAWCFEDEINPKAEAMLAAMADGDALVPEHWPLEVANVLAGAERKGRTTLPKIARFIDILSRLPIVIDSQTMNRAQGDVLPLARLQRLTAYDAAYLELALRTGCPLASLDSALNEAAAGRGIARFEG